jgi:hypothetical protein
MKTSTLPLRLLTLATIAIGAATLAGTGCSKKETTDAQTKVKDAYEDAKTAVADTWKDVKSYTFEKRDDFSANAKALTSKMDSQVQELRVNYSEAKASASRKAAMDELKSSQADYQDKVDALGRATADTWDSAKQNAVSSWDRLQAAYYKAKAD